MKEKILVSACLLGRKVRYDGTVMPVHDVLKSWFDQELIVPVCPEVTGGLPVPRDPAEICGGDGFTVLENKATVRSKDGRDVTEFFLKGALKALQIAEENDITMAIMKDGSPSCGSSYIYDGTFTKKRIAGKGVTGAVLEQHGIRVITEFQIESFANGFIPEPDANG